MARELFSKNGLGYKCLMNVRNSMTLHRIVAVSYPPAAQ